MSKTTCECGEWDIEEYGPRCPSCYESENVGGEPETCECGEWDIEEYGPRCPSCYESENVPTAAPKGYDTKATITVGLGPGCAADAAEAALENVNFGDTIDVIDENGYHWGRFGVGRVRPHDLSDHDPRVFRIDPKPSGERSVETLLAAITEELRASGGRGCSEARLVGKYTALVRPYDPNDEQNITRIQAAISRQGPRGGATISRGFNNSFFIRCGLGSFDSHNR